MSLLRFALVGHPVKHSASPAMHAAAFRSLELPHTYEAVECPGPAALKAAVGLMRKGGIAGLNVTAPHKRTVLDLVDAVDPSAAEVGAANTLVPLAGRVVAHNTDVRALVDEIASLEPRTATAVVIGAGGAASAAVAACKRAGVRVIGVTTRSWSSSEELYENARAEAFRRQGALTVMWPSVALETQSSNLSSALRLQWTDLAASADIVIQATSAGMGTSSGDEVVPVIPWDRLNKGVVVLDLVYGAKPTPFLLAARAKGLRAEDGVGMLARQAAASIELWTGVLPSVEIMRDAALRHLRK